MSGIWVESGRRVGKNLQRIKGGTLTGLATHTSTDTRVLVTNLHVLAGLSNLGEYRDPSRTEGLYHEVSTSPKKVGSFFASVPIVSGQDNVADVAICSLDRNVGAEFTLHDHPRHSSRRVIEGVVEPVHDDTNPMELTMLGAAGGEGTVTVKKVNQRRKAGGRWFTGVTILDSTNRPNEVGDSGTPCLYEVSNNRYKMACIAFARATASGVETWAFPASVAERNLGITFGNRAPTANAGTDQTVDPGATVTLLGSGSDPDGDALAYGWEQLPASESLETAKPSVTLNNSSSTRPTFTAPSGPRTLTFKLTVTDAVGNKDSNTVTVTVRTPETWGAWADTSNTRGSGASREKEQARTSNRGNHQTRWVADPEPETWGSWTRTGQTKGSAKYRRVEESRTSSYGNHQTRWVADPEPEIWGAWSDTGRTSQRGGIEHWKEQARTSSYGNRQTRWVEDI